jgi:calmodulin
MDDEIPISERIKQLVDEGIRFPSLEELGYTYRLTNAHNFDNAELATLAKQFRLLDVAGDGMITTNDARTALKRVGESATDKELSEVINQFDSFGKGLVSFQQFVDITNQLRSTVVTEQEIIEAFKIFDRDGSGGVDASELMQVMTSIGDRMTQEEAEAMIRQADTDGSGSVDYASFARIVMQTL